MTANPSDQAAPSWDVFVSYASQDKAVADAVVSTLERAYVQREPMLQYVRVD